MRIRFHEQLDALNTALIEMGALCETAIERAARALMTGDIALAKAAVLADTDIDQKEREIEGLCLKLLLQQQPVARDLRQISAALKMITDMERIGDQARDIAEITVLGGISLEGNGIHLGQMAKATIKMVTEAVDAYVRRDLSLAQSVIEYDDVVDGLFDEVRAKLIDLIREDKQNAGRALDLLMIAKYLERIGDHATNIAEWVEFSITGVRRNEE